MQSLGSEPFLTPRIKKGRLDIEKASLARPADSLLLSTNLHSRLHVRGGYVPHAIVRSVDALPVNVTRLLILLEPVEQMAIVTDLRSVGSFDYRKFPHCGGRSRWNTVTK